MASSPSGSQPNPNTGLSATLSSSLAVKLVLAIWAIAPSAAWAAPSATFVKRQQTETPSPAPTSSSSDGSGGGGSKGISAQVWVPIVVVAVLLLAIAIFSWNRRGWRFKLGNWSTAAALATGTVVGTETNAQANTRELTADLLTNGNSPAPTPNTATATAARPRRSRRNNRRTPSMISTRSLPAYMKEPGDEELVIYRGPTDMEDMPENMMNMPALEEGAHESPDSSLNMSRTNTREYGLMPDSPHDMPLLSPEDFAPEADLSGQTLIPPPNLEQLQNRPSFETLMSAADSDEHDLHEQPETHDEPDPRGDAPPYFEVVALDELNATTSRGSGDTTATIPEDPETPDTAQSQHSQQASSGSRRRSLFGFLHRNVASPPPVPPVPSNQNSTLHARTGSDISQASTSNDSHARGPSRSTHRPSHSNGSVFSLGSSHFRAISRQRSNAALDARRLNSASVISLESISAPLTHTLVRTEFMYPKSGPTPEQLKLISSRESFARFGVPYGPDSIAFHASQSRVDLAPPPEFEEVAGSSSGLSPSSLGSGGEQEDSHADAAQSSDNTADNGEASGTSISGVVRRPSLRISVATEASDDSRAEDSNNHSISQAAHESNAASSASTRRAAEQVPLPPSPTRSLAEASVNLSRAPSTVRPSQASASTPTAMTMSAPHPPPGLTPRPSTASFTSAQPPPPSAFKDPTAGASVTRSESRASSYLSFATAEESIRSSSPSPSPHPQLEIPDSASISGVSTAESPATTAPPTPRMTNTRHILDEPSETTTATPTTPTIPRSPSTISVH